MVRPPRWLVASIVVAVLAVAPAAVADAGLPMILLIMPTAGFLIIPIIAIEAVAAHRILKLGAGRAVVVSALANAASAFVGVPVTWMALTMLEYLSLFVVGTGPYKLDSIAAILLAVTVQAPWLVPHEGGEAWIVNVAAFTLCVPFFFMSVYAERFVVARLSRQTPREAVVRWSWWANAVTYGLIMAVLAAYVVMTLV